MSFSRLTFSLIFAIIMQIHTASAATTQKKYVINWKVAHGPFDLVKKATLQFKNRIEQRTKGNVLVKIHMSNTNPYKLDFSANSKDLLDIVSGNYQMAQIYTTDSAKYYPQLNVLSLPFIFENDDHVFRVLDGEVGKNLEKGLLDSSGVLRSLAFTYCGGFRIMVTNDVELKTFEDFSKLTLAYPKNAVIKQTYNALNIQTYATPKFETLKFLDENRINGFESTYPRYANSGEMSKVKIVNEVRSNVLISSILVNEPFFQSLPKEYQKIVNEEAVSAAKLERAESIRIGEEVRVNAKKNNFKIIAMSAEELSKVKKATEVVYQKYEAIFGADVIKKIIEAK